MTTLRANLKEARQEHQKLDAQIRDFRSTETSNKVRCHMKRFTLTTTHPLSLSLALIPSHNSWSSHRLRRSATVMNSTQRLTSSPNIVARNMFSSPNSRLLTILSLRLLNLLTCLSRLYNPHIPPNPISSLKLCPKFRILPVNLPNKRSSSRMKQAALNVWLALWKSVRSR